MLAQGRSLNGLEQNVDMGKVFKLIEAGKDRFIADFLLETLTE